MRGIPGERSGGEPDQASAASPFALRRQVSLETASYIGAMAGELSQLARRDGLATVSYLLDMVQLEAEQVARDRLLR
ncbi:MAG: hypothetical protein EPO23_05060 [Xanthobacteraceae bacterium]|nr:MAG: hypothetical protein EPO23_05060 [Xanthobacteraceae bacterium]